MDNRKYRSLCRAYKYKDVESPPRWDWSKGKYVKYKRPYVSSPGYIGTDWEQSQKKHFIRNPDKKSAMDLWKEKMNRILDMCEPTLPKGKRDANKKRKQKAVS